MESIPYIPSAIWIEELEIGVRLYNILKRLDKNTISDVLAVTPFDLQKFYDYRIATGQHEVAICGNTLQQLLEIQQLY